MSESTRIFEGLSKVRHWMEACLGCLESQAPEEPGFQAAWKSLNEEFAALGAVGELKDRIDPAEIEELRSRLEEVSRLHAVLATVVNKRREETSDALQNTKTLRKGLEQYSGVSGVSCDIAG